MSAEENKAVVRRFYHEVFSKGDADAPSRVSAT